MSNESDTTETPDSTDFSAQKSIIQEGELDEVMRKNWLRAVSAAEMGNFEYAIKIIQDVLKSEPKFLDGRKFLRKAEIRMTKKKKGTKIFGLTVGGGSGGSSSSRKFSGAIKKDPLKAMVEIEEALEKNPYDSGANNSLYDAAIAAGLPETATFALRTIKEGEPDNTQNLHKLAEHYIAQEDPEEAYKIYEAITKIDPSDGDAIKGGKDASAQASMKKGGWDGGSGGKKDMKEALDLEDSNRTAMTGEQIDNRIARLFEDYEEKTEAKDIDWSKEIASLYEKKEDWGNAIQWYEYSYGISNDDPALKRRVEILSEKVSALELKKLEEEIEANPDAPDAEEKRKILAVKKSDRLESLIVDAQERVDANPTDKQLRFELGQHLFSAEKYQDAIQHLQVARQNPAIRIKAMLTLGRCFSARGMNDMASKALSDANSELSTMDNMKKEVLYQLGVVYEKQDKKDESLNCFKEIYEADYNYRDVAQRVEASYS